MKLTKKLLMLTLMVSLLSPAAETPSTQKYPNAIVISEGNTNTDTSDSDDYFLKIIRPYSIKTIKAA